MADSNTLAERLGLELIESLRSELRYGIESLLPSQHFVKFSQMMQKQVGQARLVIGQVSFRSDQDTSGSTRTIEQSFSFFEQPGLGLPSLTVQPRNVGSRLFSAMGGLTGISSVDLHAHPEASRTLTAMSMQPESSRRLLSAGVLEILASKNKLTLKTDEDRMLLYWSGHVFPDDALAEFVDDSRHLFQCVHRRAIELPNLAEESRTEAIDAIQNLGGPLGNALRSRLVPEQEIDDFLSQPIPRRIPKSIGRQRVGLGSVAFYLIGLALIVIGCAITSVLATTPDVPRWGIALAGSLPLLGLVTMTLTFLYRRSQKRLLRRGTCCEAIISEVSSTRVFVNNQRRYKVTLQIDHPDGSREVTINAYEPAVKKAYQWKSSGRSTRVLADPVKPDRVFWIDSLAVI